MKPENPRPIGCGRVPHLERKDKLRHLVAVGVLAAGLLAAGSLTGCKPTNEADEAGKQNPTPSTVITEPTLTEPTPTLVLVPTTEIPSTETPTPTFTPEPTATPVPPTPTPEPTATPTPTSGIERQVNGSFVVVTEKGERLSVPQIAGLRQEVGDINGVEIVVYKAEKGNSYGLKENAYAGEFRPYVMVKEKTTGGLVLTAPVVLDILNTQLSQIPEQKDRWLIPLPVDIRDLDPNSQVSITFSDHIQYIETSVLEIRFPGKASAVNVIPDSEKIAAGIDSLNNGIYIDHLRLVEPYTDKIYPGKEMHYITIEGDLKGFPTNTTIESEFGDRVTFASGQVNVMFDSANEYREITPDKILMIEKVPVFVAANSS